MRVRPAFAVTSVNVPSRLFLYRRLVASGRRALQPRAAEHEQIEPAVVVVIEKRDAAADDLDDVALAVDAAVDDRLGQAGLLSPRP